MSKPLLESDQTFLKGEIRNLSLIVWDEGNPNNDISVGTTATVAVYDEVGGVTLASGAATVAGTTLLTVARSWDLTSVTPGEYRIVCFVTLTNGLKQGFQWKVRVDPAPAPQ